MSRYLILIILNVPLILTGILGAVVSFKLGHIGQRRLLLRLGLWTSILLGLVFAEPIYIFLFSRHLTDTEPLSLFDVIQITGIILTLFIANRAYIKAEVSERKIQDLHQELSIRIAKQDQSK